ncbi:hypothetical protein [Parasphingorhabdus pacifica]
MPIRTHRGRAAVYRRLWGWPLRSPKHLVGALVVVAGLATAVGFVLPEPPPARVYRDNPSGTEHASVPDPGSTPDQMGADAAPPTFSVPTTPPASAPASPEGLITAEKWGKKWVHHPPGTSQQQWLDELRPHTTEEFLPVMESVDPANVPATEVTGQASALESTANSIDVRLPTNSGDLEILVISTPQGWRVAGYDWAG